MIVDCHCHAGRGDRLTAPWNTHAPLTTYLRRARAAGIQKTIIIPAGHSDYSQANREIGQIVRDNPGRCIGFASVHAGRDSGRVHELVREAVTGHGLRGLKVHCYDAPPNREICDAVRAFGIPMLVDVVGRAYLVELFASQYPDVNFIIPHFGSFADDWRAQQQVVDQLVRFPNVYADTAGVRRFDFIVQGIRRAGPRKVLFGSDGPWLHPAVELHKIRMLGLSHQDESLILGGNILRLLMGAGSARKSQASRNGRRSARDVRAEGKLTANATART